MRAYSIQFENVAVTALQDLFMIAPAANKPIAIHALHISQSTEIKEAEEEMLRLQLIRGYTTVGSGGSSVTPARMDINDTVSGATCRVNDTTVASAGSPIILHSETFNVRVGFSHIWTPEMRPICTAGETRIVARLLANPTDSVSMTGTLYFSE